MTRSTTAKLVPFLLLSASVAIRSFQPVLPFTIRCVRALPAPFRDDVSTKASDVDVVPDPDAVDEMAADTSSKRATLNLAGAIKVETKSLPKRSAEEIRDFLKDRNNLQLILTGGKRPIVEVEVSDELLEKWTAECQQSGASLPTKSDVIYSVKTGGIKFPGLSLKSTSNVGTKIIDNPDNGLVDYEITMINDKSEVSGLPPVVWMYNKLTGKDPSSSGESKTSSFSRISCTVSDDSVSFTSDMNLNVRVNFPALLLRILPTNKEAAEKSGGASIQKVLQRDVTQAMAVFADTYEAKSST